MSVQTKIQLSQLEMELLNNSEWILTKNKIVKKAQRLFEEVQQNIVDYVNAQPGIFPPQVLDSSAKISKGENYLGLPWLMLDFPRHFKKENIFAIRTMFWWANFFSTTIHLSGSYSREYAHTIVNKYDDLAKMEFFICVNDQQWHHHLEKENYVSINELSKTDYTRHVKEATFIKIVRKLNLSEWNTAIGRLTENFIAISQWFN
jgi:hypothetical protein